MDYRRIMCEFCKECKEYKVNEKIVKSTDVRCGDVLIIKCDNFCPKYHFEDKSNDDDYCSFLVDLDKQGEYDEVI